MKVALASTLSLTQLTLWQVRESSPCGHKSKKANTVSAGMGEPAPNCKHGELSQFLIWKPKAGQLSPPPQKIQDSIYIKYLV